MSEEFSKGEIDRAGLALVNPPDSQEEIEKSARVLNYFRSKHNYPINTFQATLRNKLKGIDSNALVAQRLKRIPSIVSKIRRFDNMRLSRMQDIGGIRAVLSSIDKVEELYQAYKSTRFQHTLVNEKNYIDSPKPSGYRGVHLVYKYNLKSPTEFNGLYVELQIRSRIQHAWATAVETVGTFLDHSLKSSQGPEEWLEFFSLVSSAFAHIENRNLVPGYESISKKEIFKRVTREMKRIKVRERLLTFQTAIQIISSDSRNYKVYRGGYYLLVLEPSERKLTATLFNKGKLEEATEAYLREERSNAPGQERQIVLVAVDSVDALRRAYPNYFLDTDEFVNLLNKIEDESGRKTISK